MEVEDEQGVVGDNITKPFNSKVSVSPYVREDRSAGRFKMGQGAIGAPPNEYVNRRAVYDLLTGELISDETFSPLVQCDYYGTIPGGNRDIRTELYFRSEPWTLPKGVGPLAPKASRSGTGHQVWVP